MNERLLLLVLAAIQFTAIVDFLIILPLGPQYMRVFHINPGQFGLIVSAYAISAGISGVATGFVLDRFDRKRALLVLYFGFTVGTLFCALAPTYPLLVAARVVAGAFGGVAGALILAIIGDVIPEERRGAAMGMVMSSFSVASICGVPIGLVLADTMDWHLPFFVLAALSLVILLASARVLPQLRGHLVHVGEQHPVKQMMAVLSHTDHQMAFLFMAMLSFTGFVVFPNIATYMVLNVGLTERQLPLIYLAGGLATVFSLNWIGRWADRTGKLRVFTWMSLAATIPIVLVTNLPRAPLLAAILSSTLLMVCMSGRMVPAMALMTASIEARYRGGFMSINSSVQQFSCGVAAYLSGQVLVQTTDGTLAHFPALGAASVVCALICIYLARFLKAPEASETPVQGLPVEG
ncbi:MAG TPA: MFS transporter [Verrucomicrobiae bacterium]|nr:MFS transporter [Verrucomicrobiae bacterium]